MIPSLSTLLARPFAASVLPEFFSRARPISLRLLSIALRASGLAGLLPGVAWALARASVVLDAVARLDAPRSPRS